MLYSRVLFITDCPPMRAGIFVLYAEVSLAVRTVPGTVYVFNKSLLISQMDW